MIELVSILMVAHNTADFIDAAIRSARDQSYEAIEILVVDDGSTDATAQIAHAHAARDARVRVLAGRQQGLSAVRNVSLDGARGRFAIILDSDDMLHPSHVEELMRAAADQHATILATNMITFEGEGAACKAHTFAQGSEWQSRQEITASTFIKHGMIGGQGVSLGYLKPMFDMTFMRAHHLRYDERLRIGEDFDLVLRALLSGASYNFLPCATYYYRKHATSTSHRLGRMDVEGLLAATRGYAAASPACAAEVQARCSNLEGALLHLDAIAAIKRGRLAVALRLAAINPQARALTIATLREALTKRIGLTAWPNRVAAGSPATTHSLAECLRLLAQYSQPRLSSQS